MGRRGIKPQPLAELKKKDYYRPSRHDDQIAKIDDGSGLNYVHNGLPLPPERFSDKAVDIWNETLGQAQKVQGYISFIDLKLFEQYCEVYAELTNLNEECKNTNMYYTDDKGNVKEHPIFRTRKEKRAMFIKISQEFGFSPSSRTRVVLEQTKDKPKPKEDDFTI